MTPGISRRPSRIQAQTVRRSWGMAGSRPSNRWNCAGARRGGRSALRPRRTANRPMPIIEPPDPQLPLSQGDVLKGVALFITRETWAEAGGEYKKTSHRLCLVISRPCVVGHKPNAVVAAVEKMEDNVPRDVETFKDILDFLTDLRDAPDSPDVFYLGQVPGFDGRFGARLDS